jgi:glycosyltransferase involved in cell wall biosynthesis
MNIAHILPYSVKLPLEEHNGRYDWVKDLVALQIEDGHSVTIYSHPDSVLEGAATIGISTASPTRKQNNIETFKLAFSNNHDVYHSHFDNLQYEVANETDRPIVFTQHWWPHEETVRIAQNYSAPNVWAVPPTQYMYQFDLTSGIQSLGHIYHGIDLSTFKPAGTKKSGRLLFAGRISPEKNLDVAIAAAKAAGVGLDIVGKVVPKNEAYWQSLQGDIDGKNIVYLGSKNRQELIELYSSALAVLCPYEPTEPFGLVSIEAQACGTPVILKKGGSRAEIVIDGKTGFLCESINEYVDAIRASSSIESEECVAFAGLFDIRTMAQKYNELYKKLIS